MVLANFPFYLNFSWKIEKKTYIKIKKFKKIMGQIRGENIGGGKNFLLKPCPPQGKSEMAPLNRFTEHK